MHKDKKNILLISMPFAGIGIPSIQLAILESYLKERNIDIKTKNLYLKAAELYGIINYNFLIYPPNDSYTAQMVFSRYVFPDHWSKNEGKCRIYYKKKILKNKPSYENLTFENYVQKTDMFYNWVLENVEWKNYDIIGFTLNYGQFLPSLAIAKKIKELNPEKKIVLGGSRTVGNLGIRVLESFDFVDFIVSGDGEESLYHLTMDYQNYESIPGLIYRKGEKAYWNDSDNNIDLNDQSIPSYNSFFEELNSVSVDVQQYFHYFGYLPVEISRGCWWNKCSFCNLNLQHPKYREKNVDKIVEEIQFLSDNYKMLNFQFIGNTLPAKNCKDLFTKIIALGKDFNIITEARADHLKSEDYELLKQAGFTTIQTGIESFSSSYLKKMNKGAQVIDNIAALKFCKENDIKNTYNLIVDYPNEETVDFEETKKTIRIFKQYLEPPQICYLRVLYGSPIHCNPDKFNISQLDYADIDRLMFPQEVLDKELCFVYTYKNNKTSDNKKWEQLVDNWKIQREMLKIEGIRSQNTTDQLIFYYADGGNFVKIYDKRNLNNIQIYNLNEIERKIFLSCINIVSFEKLKEKISDISENDLIDALETFVGCGIIFKEDDLYLSLPLSYSKIFRNLNQGKIEQESMVTQVT